MEDEILDPGTPEVDETPEDQTPETYTKEQVDELLSKARQSGEDSVRGKYSKEKAELEKKLKELEFKNMSKEKREEAILKEKEEAYRKMELELNTIKMQTFATSKMNEASIGAEYQNIAKNFLIGASEEITEQNIKAFQQILLDVKKTAVEEFYKTNGRDFKNETDKVTITKKEFNEMKWADKMKIKDENPALFKLLTE